MVSIVPTNFASPLTGNEQIRAFGNTTNGMQSGQDFYVTTEQIAQLASLDSAGEVITTINTVGAGTLTAASILGLVIARTGTQVAIFTDTTATAAQIIAALPPSAGIGTSFEVIYNNNTAYTATITGGIGVTVSGITSVYPNGWVTYLFTYTAANTMTAVGIQYGWLGVAPLDIGAPGYVDTGVLEQLTGASNNYQQMMIQNTTTGTSASADHIVSNDLGTATTYYGDFGINSSTFSGTGNLDAANATYLTATSGDLSLGTVTSNAIHFVVGHSATDAVTIATTGVTSFNKLIYFYSADALTASATQTQGGGTVIAAMQNRFTTVATAGNAATLPTAVAGMNITVVNAAAANYMQVFPAVSGFINGQAVNTSFIVPPNTTVEFVSTVANYWHTIATQNVPLPVQFQTNSSATSTTLTAANISGVANLATPVEIDLSLTGAPTTAQTLTLPTVASVFANIPNAIAGQTYKLRIINTGGTSSGVWTVGTTSGYTLNGTMTIAVSAWSDFIVTLTSTSAIALQRVGAGTL